MNRYKLMICATVAAFALSALPVGAQRPGGGGEGGGGGERPSGGPSGGSAGGGSGPAGPSGGGGGGGGSSSGGGGSSVGSPSSDSGGFTGPSRPTAAPRNPNAPERRGGGDRAVPRGAGASGGGDSRGSARVGSAGAGAGSPDRVTEPSDRAVPAYSRPREGRPATGSAVDRQYPIVRGGRNDVYYPYYSNYYSRYYWPGYGFGLGFYGYDPFWFDPYYDPYFTGYYGGSGGYSYQGPRAYGESGALRLKIKPREAKVYVDGYFVGEVDGFDGIFQKLGLEAGGHQVEIRADGYETAQFEVLITPGETVTYRGDLKRIQ